VPVRRKLKLYSWELVNLFVAGTAVSGMETNIPRRAGLLIETLIVNKLVKEFLRLFEPEG
jgi:hypothetical protein